MTNDEGMIKVAASATMLWRGTANADLILGVWSFFGAWNLELLRDRHISDEEGSFLSI